MNVIEFDLSAIKPQKNNYKTKSLKYIKHLHKTIKDLEVELKEKKEIIKDLETDIFVLKLDKEYKQILGIQIAEEESKQLKERWNKLKEYINYKKSIYDKRIPTEFCTNELIGKRMLAEELIYKIEKLEKGSN